MARKIPDPQVKFIIPSDEIEKVEKILYEKLQRAHILAIRSYIGKHKLNDKEREKLLRMLLGGAYMNES